METMMRVMIQLVFLLVIYYKQGLVSGQYYPQTCCNAPIYQSPATCCPQPCCVQTAAPVLCCQTQEVMKLRLTLKTLLTWDKDYDNPKSAKFIALAKKVQDALKKIYAKTPSFADARVSQFTKGSTIATFVLAFKLADPDPLKPLRDALPLKYIPDGKDAGKIQVDPNSLVLVDKVIPQNVKANLDTKPTPTQESDLQLKVSVFNSLNEKRKIHGDKALVLNQNLVKASYTWAVKQGKDKKLSYSPDQAKKQSEISILTCKEKGKVLTGQEIVDKIYSEEAKLYFNPKISLTDKATKAKRFMQAMWKSSTNGGVGVYSYKSGTSTCFAVALFLTPKATSLTSKTVVDKNILKGSYKIHKDEIAHDDTAPAVDTEITEDATDKEPAVALNESGIPEVTAELPDEEPADDVDDDDDDSDFDDDINSMPWE